MHWKASFVHEQMTCVMKFGLLWADAFFDLKKLPSGS
jgi:hypothetical protein